MTGKERLVKAFTKNGEPDRVPIVPGLDNVECVSLSGLDYWNLDRCDSGGKRPGHISNRRFLRSIQMRKIISINIIKLWIMPWFCNTWMLWQP